MSRMLLSSSSIVCSVSRTAGHRSFATASLRAGPSQVDRISGPQGSNFLSGSLNRPGKRQMNFLTRTAAATAEKSPYDFTVKDIDGKPVDLGKYKGSVVLVVNVASQCGFTPQYKELGQLYDKYQGQGFVILGFPCNQFGGQEPADNSKIKQFALDRGAKFPMMAKVDVNGGSAEPFYSFLKSKQGGLLVSDIKWNFTKFLVDREGNVVKRYGSATTPLSIEADIKQHL